MSILDKIDDAYLTGIAKAIKASVVGVTWTDEIRRAGLSEVLRAIAQPEAISDDMVNAAIFAFDDPIGKQQTTAEAFKRILAAALEQMGKEQ